MLRLTALLPLLCAIGALILSFLSLFAGWTKGFLQDAPILTLNTSEIGHNLIGSSSSSNPFSSFLHNLTNPLLQGIDNDITSIAHEIGIHDFYTAHIMDYCEGYYLPNATSKHPKPHKTTTRCSNHTAFFHFDPAAIISSELNDSITLQDLKWPNDIQHELKILKVAERAMFVLLCIGIGFTALTMFGSLIGLFAAGRLIAFTNWVLSILSFLTLAIAVSIITAVAVKATSAINKYGKGIGISASKGGRLLGMTWAAVGLMLLASCVWIFECVLGSRAARAGRRDGSGRRFGGIGRNGRNGRGQAKREMDGVDGM
ncbi:MAG: hypothetical protein M1819_001964 [Sarea resinae]|nr:MAG: hypothetical protein M1819_001964 [Sarea resinae]